MGWTGSKSRLGKGAEMNSLNRYKLTIWLAVSNLIILAFIVRWDLLILRELVWKFGWLLVLLYGSMILIAYTQDRKR